MSEVKRYDAVHLRDDGGNIRYGLGCEVEVVTAEDYDRLAAENERLKSELEGEREQARDWLLEHHEQRAELEALKQPAALTQDTIRAVFLRNGFTIKEGHDDLKPYVYAAANELLQLQAARLKRHSTGWTPITEGLPDEDVDVLCKCLDGETEFYVVASQHNSFFTDFDHAPLTVTDWHPIPPKSDVSQQLTGEQQQDQSLDGSPAQKSFWAGFEAAALSLHGTDIRSAWNEFKAYQDFPAVNQQLAGEQQAGGSCKWVRDNDTEAYETECGKTWHLSDGGYPEEHGQLFCHHCGMQIEEVAL